jgi:hypothetical protein
MNIDRIPTHPELKDANYYELAQVFPRNAAYVLPGDMGVSPKILLISPFAKGGLRGIRDTGGWMMN